MKKIALLIFFASFAHEGVSQVWDSIGSGLPAPSGVRRVWKIEDRLFASTSEVNANLFEFNLQNGWTQIISSSQPGQIWDMEYDSINNQAILLGKFEDLNSVICNSLAKFNLATGSVLPIGSGLSFPDEYAYSGKMINGEFYVSGRFCEVNGLDTIYNFMKINLQTESYQFVCGGNSGDLIRDFCVYNNDIYLIGSFLRNGTEFPLVKITPAGLDFSINGPYRGFGYSLRFFNNTLIVAGNIRDTMQNNYIVGSYDGINFSTLLKTNNSVRKLEVFKNELFISGSFDSVNCSGLIFPAKALVKYDGVSISDVNGGCTGINSSVWDLFSTEDTLYVAGNFTQAGSVQALNVARFVVPSSTGLQNENTSDGNVFSVYPNPTDGNFQISSRSNFESKVLVEIFDISGRKLKEFVSDLSAQVNLDLPNGVYFIKINESTKKLVVRK